jgi:hypothetical protein
MPVAAEYPATLGPGISKVAVTCPPISEKPHGAVYSQYGPSLLGCGIESPMYDDSAPLLEEHVFELPE